MLNLRSRNVLRDLWDGKLRTLLVVLSIATGVLALSLSFRTRAIVSHTILHDYAATHPSDIELTTTPFSTEMLATVRGMPGVRTAEGVSRFQTRIKIGSEWRPLFLLALPDFPGMQLNQVTSVNGAWPPPDGTLLLERSQSDVVGLQPGASLLIEAANGEQRTLPLAGLVHDLYVSPGKISTAALYGYLSMSTVESLGVPPGFNELRIAVDEHERDREHVQNVAAQVRDRLERAGTTVSLTYLPTPDTPELYRTTEAILTTLAALGTLSLVLSTFLIINAISALLVRQVPRIGILKAIGSPQRDLVVMYLSSVLVIAVLATIVAVLGGMLGARALSRTLGDLLNYDVRVFAVPLNVVAIEIGAGLVVPLLAALPLIISGTRITVQQAISSQGVAQVGGGAAARTTRRRRGIPTAIRYAVRNMFRRKIRLTLTLITLSLGGALMIAVLSVYASLGASRDQAIDYWRQDIRITFPQSYPVERIAGVVQNVPGVIGTGFRTSAWGMRERPDGTESEAAAMVFGLESDNRFLRPQIVQGRWLRPDDRDAVVVNLYFLEQEPGVAVGDMITLSVAGRKASWRIVGVVIHEVIPVAPPMFNQANVYMNDASFAEALGAQGQANEALIITEHHDAASLSQVRQALDARLTRNTMPAVLVTHAEMHEQVVGIDRTITLLLLIMAVLFTLVGGLSLMSAMSLNVLERTKEIGVLRAVGASNSSVVQIVLTEGVCVGVVSWLLATVLAVPLSRLLSTTIGMSTQKWPLVFTFPPTGILIWLGIVVALAALVSYLPARGAVRVTVRDVLAYE